MSTKRRGLGRGLDALLGASADAHVAAVVADHQLRELPLDLIERGRFQPRMHIAPEALEELTQSIRARGVVQPCNRHKSALRLAVHDRIDGRQRGPDHVRCRVEDAG